MKHSPGPWQIDDNAIIANIDGGYGDDGSQIRFDTICQMQDEYLEQLDNWKANALLVASAPEMLEALEACVLTMQAIRKYANDSFIDRDEKRLQKAIEVIKKAKGE